MTICPLNHTLIPSMKWLKGSKKYIQSNLWCLMLKVWNRVSKSKLKARSFLRAKPIKITLIPLKNFSSWRCWEGELLERLCSARTKRTKNTMPLKVWGRRILFKNNISVKPEHKDFYSRKVSLSSFSQPSLPCQVIIRIPDKIKSFLRHGLHTRRIDVYPPKKEQTLQIIQSQILCSSGFPCYQLSSWTWFCLSWSKTWKHPLWYWWILEGFWLRTCQRAKTWRKDILPCRNPRLCQ